MGRKLADQYLVVPLAGRGVDADCLYIFNRMAAFLWEAPGGQRRGHDLVTAVLDQYDQVGSGGKHHEIYLGDPRKADPSKLKTILGHPIKKA